MPIDDEVLLAYLDGQLESDAAYQEVELALAASDTLRQRLQQLVDSGALARAAFDTKLQEPVPAHLIETVWNAPWPGHTGTASESRAAAAGPGSWRVRPGLWWSALSARRAGWLAGAAMASLVWAATGMFLLPGPGSDPGQTAAARSWPSTGSPLEDELLLTALEGIPSAQPVTVHGRSVALAGSFQRPDGSFCRELEERRQQGGQVRTTRGLACRSQEAGWQIAFQHSDSLPTQDSYGTASDASHQAVDDFLASQPGMVVLGQDQELRKIRDGWRR